MPIVSNDFWAMAMISLRSAAGSRHARTHLQPLIPGKSTGIGSYLPALCRHCESRIESLHPARVLRLLLPNPPRLRDHRLGAVTTGPSSGFEIFVPGRQDSSQSEIPFTGAPISFVGAAPLRFSKCGLSLA
jgi:hypothetical protein